jgi:putative cell wall-binding protein
MAGANNTGGTRKILVYDSQLRDLEEVTRRTATPGSGRDWALVDEHGADAGVEVRAGGVPVNVHGVRGDSFADAASAAARAGQLRAPLLFTTSPIELGSATADFLRAHAGTIDSIDVIGGPSAISDAVVAQARAASTG